VIVSCKSFGVELSILEEVIIDVVVDELPKLADNAGIRRCHGGNSWKKEMIGSRFEAVRKA
jgi:hypothetical protein